MEYKLAIMRDGEPVLSIGVTADEVIAAIALALPNARMEEGGKDDEVVVSNRPRKYKKRKEKKGERQKKWHKADKKGQELSDDIEEFHKARHPETERIEQLLIDGKSVQEVLAEVKVSAPTVYVIKTRLRQEGKIK